MKNTKDNISRRGAFPRRLLSLVSAVFFIFATLSVPVLAVPAGDVTAADMDLAADHIKSAYLYNIENDFTILSYAAEDTVYPTSTVKIMSGIIAMENLTGRLYETVTITEEMIAGVGGNNIGLKAGEEITIESLLYAMLVGGANDAAQSLAILVAGSVEDFVLMMNARAIELGAKNTHYTNPSGIHDAEMYTTAKDTALIALAAYEIPLFMTITSTSKYVIPETNKSEFRNVYSRNYLISTSSVLKYYYSDAAGMNSGSTSQGGYCLVTTAQRDGLTYLAVVMGADADTETDTIYSYTEAIKMLNYAFSSYANVTLVSAGEMICEIPVTLSGTTDYVTLVTKESMSMYMPLSVDLETEIKRSYKTSFESLEAPVKEGAVAGILTVMYNDEIVGNIELITTVSVARSEFLFFLEEIRTFVTGRLFITTVIAAVVITILYVISKAIWLHKKSQSRYRRWH